MENNKMSVYEESSDVHTQYVQQKNGIPKERILNYNQILIIEDLVKCSIWGKTQHKKNVKFNKNEMHKLSRMQLYL